MENFSGAEIKAVCTEAGYFAIRKDKFFVTKEDFFKAIEKSSRKKKKKAMISLISLDNQFCHQIVSIF